MTDTPKKVKKSQEQILAEKLANIERLKEDAKKIKKQLSEVHKEARLAVFDSLIEKNDDTFKRMIKAILPTLNKKYQDSLKSSYSWLKETPPQQQPQPQPQTPQQQPNPNQPR